VDGGAEISFPAASLLLLLFFEEGQAEHRLGVDRQMRAVAEATQTVDSVRVAVLAAMALADELHTGQDKTGGRDEALRERAQQCLTILERALKQTA